MYIHAVRTKSHNCYFKVGVLVYSSYEVIVLPFYGQGKVFDRLTVIEQTQSTGSSIMYLCRCECGNTKKVTAHDLNSGNVRSCGCLQTENRHTCRVTHGHSKSNQGRPTPTYHSWLAMQRRCLDRNRADYSRYGGRKDRPVVIHMPWEDYAVFLHDKGERPPGTTLDRWPDPWGDYTPENTRWATREQQDYNKRNTVTFAVRCQREANKPTYHSSKAPKHGHAKHGKRTPEHMAWNSMMRRCYSVDDKDYPNCGGRGITVCDAWRKFAGFFAAVGQRPAKHQLRRIDQDRDFTPENCKWASKPLVRE